MMEVDVCEQNVDRVDWEIVEKVLDKWGRI